MAEPYNHDGQLGQFKLSFNKQRYVKENLQKLVVNSSYPNDSFPLPKPNL